MAAYYIYRNLRLPGAFSVRHLGKVVARHSLMAATNVKFQVSQSGRMRVLRERQKNVHAYVVAQGFSPYAEPVGTSLLQRISYNPYKQDCFTVDGSPIYRAKLVIFEGGSCWLVQP
jgi:hypothetical protein